MIGIRLNGGLGNQMFQYACGRALSFKHKTHLLLDTSELKKVNSVSGITIRDFELEIFPIKASVAKNEDIKNLKPLFSRLINTFLIKICFKGIQWPKYFVERSFAYNSSINTVAENCYLMGYWQSPSYFEGISDIIYSDFKFPYLDAKNSETANKISTCDAVSIHIRRGDFLNSSAHGVHGVCSLDYYRKAIAHIKSKTHNPVFFIFSDDITWAMENLNISTESHYIKGNTGSKSYVDMQLMSLCKHNIIANSSFSWWGAWLNQNPEKIVIAPVNWFSNEALNKQTVDLMPERWIRM